MGYELPITRILVGLIFDPDHQTPPTIPGPPRGLKPGETLPPSGVIGGSINHEKLALVARLLWLLIRMSSDGLLLFKSSSSSGPQVLKDLARATLAHLITRLKYELTVAWESRSGEACEQTAASHGQWNETAAWGAFYIGLKYRDQLTSLGDPNSPDPAHDLASIALAWIRASYSVLRIFAPPVPWLTDKGKLSPTPALLTVGARPYSDEAGNPVSGRCFVRDAQYQWLTTGKRPQLGDPFTEIDNAALHIMTLVEREYLPNLRDLITASPNDIPPLRMTVQKYDSFSGPKLRAYYLPNLAGVSQVQRLAGIRDGSPFFGFDDSPPPKDGRVTFIYTGHPITQYLPVPATNTKGGTPPVSSTPKPTTPTTPTTPPLPSASNPGPYTDIGASLYYHSNLTRTAFWGQPSTSPSGTTPSGTVRRLFNPEARSPAILTDAVASEARYGSGSFSGLTNKGSQVGEAMVGDVAVDVYTHPSNPGNLTPEAVAALKRFGLSAQDKTDIKMVEGAKSYIEATFRRLFKREPGRGEAQQPESEPGKPEPTPEPQKPAEPVPTPTPTPTPEPPPVPITPPTTPPANPDPPPSSGPAPTLIPLPDDIRTTLTWLSTLTGPAQIGPGQRARIARLRRWVESVSR